MTERQDLYRCGPKPKTLAGAIFALNEEGVAEIIAWPIDARDRAVDVVPKDAGMLLIRVRERDLR